MSEDIDLYSRIVTYEHDCTSLIPLHRMVAGLSYLELEIQRLPTPFHHPESSRMHSLKPQ